MNGTISAADIGHGPLYKRVKSLLTQSLAEGEWKPNEAIPSESRLAERFDVSIGTVRKAIDELTAERILVRQQGRGTFVASHTQSRFLYHFYHVVGEDGIKRFPSPELLQFRRIRAEPHVATRLGIEKGARVIHVRNLLRIEGHRSRSTISIWMPRSSRAWIATPSATGPARSTSSTRNASG
jgi:GntR family transcriptional regulator